MADVLTRWSVTDETLETASALADQVTAAAREQGHGLVSMSLSFTHRRLRVAVADATLQEAPAVERTCGGEVLTVGRDHGSVRWFELTHDTASRPT